jgi:Leucine-rich repeat (LRR) protein
LTNIDDFQFSRASRLKKLKLYNNKISSLSRKSFYGLESVEEIFLKQNYLTEINLADFALPNLNYLNVGSNQISRVIKEDPNLELNVPRLDIYDNQLVDISNLDAFKELRILNIGHNPQIENLQIILSEFVKLTALFLTDTNLKQIYNSFNFLSKMSELNYLNLMENDLETLDLYLFPVLPKVKRLNLRKNKLTKIYYQVLKDKFPALQQLQISENDWDCEFLDELFHGLDDLGVQLSFEYASNIRNPKRNVLKGIQCIGQPTPTTASKPATIIIDVKSNFDY